MAIQPRKSEHEGHEVDRRGHEEFKISLIDLSLSAFVAFVFAVLGRRFLA